MLVLFTRYLIKNKYSVSALKAVIIAFSIVIIYVNGIIMIVSTGPYMSYILQENGVLNDHIFTFDCESLDIDELSDLIDGHFFNVQFMEHGKLLISSGMSLFLSELGK